MIKWNVLELTFCTLMLWLVLLKIRLALIAFANLRAFGDGDVSKCCLLQSNKRVKYLI